MKYDPDLHHRKSIRLKGWDYSWAAAYFVTICTEGRACLFGEITNREPQFSVLGQLIDEYWRELAERFAPNIVIDQYVLMPNHLHGIIIINSVGADPRVRPDSPSTPISLSRIIQWYKSVTTHVAMRGVNDGKWTSFDKRLWQRGYYDRIIRNEREMDATRGYIFNNPACWEADTENPNHI